MKTFFIFLILILCASGVKSQSDNKLNRPIWGFSFLTDYPTSQFSKAGYKPGWGMSVEYYSRNVIYKYSKDWSLRIGESFYGSGQGRVNHHVLLHDPDNAPGKQNLHNTIAGLELHSMVLREKGKVRPYIDVFVGWAVFSSEQTLTIDHPVKGYQTQTTTSIDDYSALEYGSSLGCLVQLSENTFMNLKGTIYGYSNSVRFDDLNNLGYDGKMYVPNNPLAHPSMMSGQIGFIFKIPYRTYSPTYRSSGGHYYHSSGGHCGGGHCGGGHALH